MNSDGERAESPQAVVVSETDRQLLLRWYKRKSVQRYVRIGLRLLGMGPAEIAHRLTLVFKRVLRESGRVNADARQSGAAHKSGEGWLSDFSDVDLLKRLKERFDSSFFYGPSERVMLGAHLNKAFPSCLVRTVALAEAIETRGVRIFTRQFPVVPGQIDWQADPISGHRMWPEGFLDENEAVNNRNADVKYVWEVNRHQFLSTLGRAFWLTDDPRYARQAVAIIDDWIENNPVGKGVNWCSHLEVAVRAISWLWTMPFLLAWTKMDARFLRRWLKSIAEHYDYLCNNLSVYTDPTNHLIGEATALWMLSTCLGDLPETRHQADRSLAILAREIARQVTPDGVNNEQAASYHRFVLDFYLQVLILGRRTGTRLPDVIEQRVVAMLDFVAALAGGGAEAPMIGDSDDARGIPMTELVGWDFRDILSTGATLFERPDWKSMSGGFAEASFWLLGIEGAKRFDDLPKSKPMEARRIFPDGGYCFFDLRSPDGKAELIFDVGPLGLWPNAAHGHADALSIQVRVGDKFLLTDPGTGAYFSCRATRDAFRATASHNTLTVDNLDQADIFDTFKWLNPMNASLVDSFIGEDFFFAAGVHDGYWRLRRPIVHHRIVLCVRSSGWIIVDRLEGKGKHLFTRHFHFVPETEIKRCSEETIITIDRASGHGLLFTFPSADQAGRTALHIDRCGKWSDAYGHWQSAPCLSVENRAEPTIMLFTFVEPIYDGHSFAYTFGTTKSLSQRLSAKGAFLCSKPTNGENSSVSDLVVVNPTSQDLSIPDEFRSDAEFVFLRKNEDGQIIKAFLVGENRYLFGPNFQLRCSSGRFARY